MLTQKALTKKLTATYCSTTNNVFIHKANIKASNVYTQNTNKIIRNLNAQQQAAFKQLPNTCKKVKRFNFKAFSSLQKLFV
mgnify:CR=1 FL=1